MKKNLFAIACLASVLVSCSKEINGAENLIPVEEKTVKVSFAVEQEENSKAQLGEDLSVNFEEGDKIAVVDGSATLREFTIKKVDNKPVITGEISEEATQLYFVYPYSEDVAVENGVVKANIPAAQNPAEGNIAPKALAQVAVLDLSDEANTVFFKNIVSLVKFTINCDNVKSVTFRGKGGEKFCGDVNVNVSNIDNVTVDCADQMSVVVAPAEGTFAQGTYYAAIAPKAFTGGVEVITRTTADLRVLETESELTFARKGGKNLGSVATNAKTVVLPFAITTEKELTDFAKYDRFYDEEDEVTIENDINLAAASWEPFTLRCSLDGKNHTIDNVKVAKADTAAFISKLGIDAVLKNITIGSNSTITISGDDVENSFAGVIGYARRGTIDNVTNCAVVSSENGTSRTDLHMGGVLGRTESKTFITNCTNKGAVTSNSTVSRQCFLGGIAGYLINYTVTFEDCTNTAAVTNKGKVSGNLRVGGMIGSFYFDGDKTLTIKDCTNSGKISNNSKTLPEIRVGGILGSVTGASVKVDGCRNTGIVASTITVTGGTTNTCVGGIIGYAAGKNTSVENSICDITATNGIDLTGNSQSTFTWAAGGFIGYSGSNTQKIESCKFSAVMRVRSKSGSAAYKWGGATVGRISGGIIIKNTLVRGTVTGTEINADNWNTDCISSGKYSPFYGYDDKVGSGKIANVLGEGHPDNTGNGYWSSYPAL